MQVEFAQKLSPDERAKAESQIKDWKPKTAVLPVL
jgi:hypothetical protein